MIEAVVLISIVGILAMSAVPRFLSMSDMDAIRAHREALSDLRYAHQLSTASGCSVQVDFTSNGYTLTQRTDCRTGAYTQSITDPSTNEPSFVVSTPSGTAVSSSVDPLIFDSLGRATTTGGVVTTATITIGGRGLEAIGETGLVRRP